MSYSKRQLEAVQQLHEQELEELHSMLLWQEAGEPDDNRPEILKEMTMFEFEAMLKHHVWSIYLLDSPEAFQRSFDQERLMMEYARRHSIEYMTLYTKYATGKDSERDVNDLIF